MQQPNNQTYVEPQTYLTFLEDKPLWFVLTIAVGVALSVLVYYLAPKFWANKNCEEQLKKMQEIIDAHTGRLKSQDELIAELRVEANLRKNEISTFIGAYQMLRHQMPDLPTFEALKNK